MTKVKSKLKLKDNPHITVILPFYNAENTINRAIESICNQSFTNFECILINNNSTDKSEHIANQWVKIDTRFKLINESQQGVMFASNTGAKIAKGKYIARMDADDWSFPNRLKDQAYFLDNNTELGAVSGLVEYIPHKSNTQGFIRYVHWINSVKSAHDISVKQFIEAPIVNPSAMWRKEIGEQYGLYKDGDFPEDYEMWLRWLNRGVKIQKIDKEVIQWYDSESRLTRTHKIYSDSAFYQIKTQYLALWLKHNNIHYPKVVVWGASKTSRQHAVLLEKNNIEIQYYIDTKRTRQLPKRTVFYKDLPTPEEVFVLVYMKHSDIKTQIQAFLNERGFIEGNNYLLIS